MIDVLETTKYVVGRSKLVTISQLAINELCDLVSEKDLKMGELDITSYKWPLEQLIQLTFVFNTVNACFWAKPGESKWTIEINGQKYDGAIAWFRCLEEAARKNSDFLSQKNLANLSEDEFLRITKGNVIIPLFKERIQLIREFGHTKIDWLEESEYDAINLVELLSKKCLGFDDVSKYKGKKIAFYKRAQLNSKMINDVLIKNKKRPLSNLNKLTAFADYKIPQILRKLGVMVYSEYLANIVDNYIQIGANSEEEIEIRANMIWAVELIRQKLSHKFGDITSSHVDSMLWTMSQKKTENEKPYHRTLTLAY